MKIAISTKGKLLSPLVASVLGWLSVLLREELELLWSVFIRLSELLAVYVCIYGGPKNRSF